MFDAMTPLGIGGKEGKDQDDDSEDEKAPRRRRAGRAGNGGGGSTPTPKKEDPDAELKKEVSKIIKGSGPIHAWNVLHHHGFLIQQSMQLSGNWLACPG